VLTESDYNAYNYYIMISVGIKELKTNLSRYIDLVKSGENVLVTEHNHIVAELKSPVFEVSEVRDQKVFDKLVAEGKLIPAKRNASKILKSESEVSLNHKSIGWWKEYQESKSKRH